MLLTVETLKKTGSFTGLPVQKEIEWESGGVKHTATTYVRPLGYHAAKADIMALNEGRDRVAERIAAQICDEQGNPVFTAEDILGTASPDRGPIDGPIVVALLVAIQEVSNLGKSTN